MLFGIIAPNLAVAESNNDEGAQPQPVSFRDIQSHWAYNEIMELSAAGIVAGFEDGSFQPTGNVTREQFLKMLVELRKLPQDSMYVPFEDVEQERWSIPYIAAGLTNGILLLTDFPDGFKPSQPITRYEMAVWIVRALQLPPQKDEKLLENVKDQADIMRNRDLIEAALGTGIIQGYPDGTFKGGNNSTRAEAAVMLVRALHYKPGQLPSPEPEATRKIVEYRPEVKQSKSTNYSKKDDVTWIIKDPELKLNVGDVFVMPPNDEYYGGIAKKVESVSQENGALVVKTSVPKIREVFSKLDVHSIEPINPKMLVPADPSIQISTNDVSIEDTSLKLPCFKIAMKNASFEGIVLDAGMNFCNLGAIADIGLDIDVDWFDVDLDFYAKLVLTGDITTNVTVKAKGALTQSKFIPLTTPFYVPVFTGVFIKGQLYLRIDPDFKASLEIKFEDRFHLEQGFSYSIRNGFRPINNTTNTATLDVNSNVNASLAAGPDFQLTLTLLDIAYAGIELYPGIRAGYYRYYEQGRCDNIRVDAFLKLDVIAGYDVWVAKGKVKKTLLDLNAPLYQQDIHCPPPPAPNNLNAKLNRVLYEFGKFNEAIIDRTDVKLSWEKVGAAKSYNVKRSDSPGGPFVTKRSNLTTTTFTDTTAQKGNTYYYQVTAVNQYGESAPSRTLSVKIVDLPPPEPQNLTAARGGSGVVLNWNNVGGFVVYNVKRANADSKGLETIATQVTGTTFTDTTASYLKSYLYVVTAVDKYGESGLSNWAWVDKGINDLEIRVIDPEILKQGPIAQLIIPPAPDNFIAESQSGKVILSWNKDDNVTSYNVKRSHASEGTYATISSTDSDTFTDTTVENGKTYYYKVTAVNNIGIESKDSVVKEAKPESAINLKDIIIIKPDIPIIPIFVVLPAPGNFNADTDIGSGKVILSWKAVEGATGYNVMRSDAANGTYQTIGDKVSGTTFTDTTAAIGKTYYYKVTAVNNNGAESKATPIKSAAASYGIR
ncbi:S-layer homology domain-containing protein [Paenibacillus contaminans]|uniref:Uncharacterized protein n=1 Tax=Paenibacillus contaminans TaxID=450362 RepID=A0A329M3G2_9BACL|nr:S-layer homology domain-containing protein [Paenibacillus contaminans]RAV11487.1 hypothetical protein DQG23_36190 [Paenibacillus contaminans]